MVITSIAHRLAHLWLGHLVTINHWGDMWFIESLVSYLTSKAVDKIRPDWNMSEHLQLKLMNTLLKVDANLKHTTTVRNLITPTGILENFNFITNYKVRLKQFIRKII